MPSVGPLLKSLWASFLAVASTFAGGFGLGWIMGMSVTPVTQTVVAAIIALAVAVANALIGLRAETEAPAGVVDPKKPADPDKPRRVTPLPFGSLLIGLAAGSAVGIWSRTHDVLGPDLDARILEWKATKYADSLIARRLFDRTYPPLTKDNAAPKGEAATGNPFLYNISVENCGVLRQASPDSAQLITQLRVVGDQHVDTVVSQCNSLECMRALVNVLCADSSQRD
jgi:hypothetical protein